MFHSRTEYHELKNSQESSNISFWKKFLYKEKDIRDVTIQFHGIKTRNGIAMNDGRVATLTLPNVDFNEMTMLKFREVLFHALVAHSKKVPEYKDFLKDSDTQNGTELIIMHKRINPGFFSFYNDGESEGISYKNNSTLKSIAGKEKLVFRCYSSDFTYERQQREKASMKKTNRV